MFKDTEQQLNAVEINDLISSAIANAAERRKPEKESDRNLCELSDEESKQIAGGKFQLQ